MTNAFRQQDNRGRKGVSIERKLAAILSADVEGYSRLMGEDDEATIRTFTAYREVTTALIEQHHGRVRREYRPRGWRRVSCLRHPVS